MLRRVSSSASEKTAGFFTQLWELSKREALMFLRNKMALAAFFIFPIVMKGLFATIFWQVGNTSLATYHINSHLGAMTLIAINAMFAAAQPLLMRFPLDRGLFLREYAVDTYGGAAYFLSKMAVEVPQGILKSAIIWGIIWFPAGFHGNYVSQVVASWLTGMGAGSVALLVGSIASNAEAAQQGSPLVF